MVFRVYTEKKAGFDVEATRMGDQLRTVLDLPGLEGVRVINRYDVEGISEDLFRRCLPTVFSQPQTDRVSFTLEEAVDLPGQPVLAELVHDPLLFAVAYLPGQLDQRAASAEECIQLMGQGERPRVATATLYLLEGDLDRTDIERIQGYIVNPVEARLTGLDRPATLSQTWREPDPVPQVEGFRHLDKAGLSDLIDREGLAMDLADAVFCRDHYRQEGRDPSLAELKVIDTYWSDHCRHTTFGTSLEHVSIEDDRVAAAFRRYLEIREKLGRTRRPVCLMDMATIGASYLRKEGVLTGLDDSEEVNACTVRTRVDVDGREEDWLFLFKNETHNHPTEIEPFGGAATCIGGAIRDPLSGRGYVYQAMRVTGAADPRTPVEDTLPGKLPQRRIVQSAAQGYSSYGNQIGIATGQVSEIYHPGYAAKHMEVGAVVAATPADHVVRERPRPGDLIVLVGGRTGRDGIGGATGASKSQNSESLEECSAEVQKGDAPEERRLQRLFRRRDVSRLIKRCNDFGAGGVAVAVGELADGLEIDLDRVPLKYQGLNGTEIAISESQERMAVALDAGDADTFIAYAHEENLQATVIARVVEEAHLRMTWRGTTVVDIPRDFLSSNGAPKSADAFVGRPGAYSPPWSGGGDLAERMGRLLADINVSSHKGLAERFDSTIGGATVLLPFGGRRQLTPSQAMVSKFPVEGHTDSASAMAWGFNPFLTEEDPYTGAYLAVVESVCRLVATGFSRHRAYLSLQEYFPKPGRDPARWGRPMAALLGALDAQLDLGVGAIGGKDSMSGTFEHLEVPPTLISFAVALGRSDQAISPEFKRAGSPVFLLTPEYRQGGLIPDAASLVSTMDYLERLEGAGLVQAASTPGYGCVAQSLFEMSLGNRLGLALDPGLDEDTLFRPAYGSFLLVLEPGRDLPPLDKGVHATRLGTTTADYSLTGRGNDLDLSDLEEVWARGLEDVYPYRGGEGGIPLVGQVTGRPGQAEAKGVQGPCGSYREGDAGGGPPAEPAAEGRAGAGRGGIRPGSGPDLAIHGEGRPLVLIPVFPGTNCEYDSARAFRQAGARVSTVVIRNLTPQDVSDSVDRLAAGIASSQIVMLPGGFSGGDEPDGSAKFIASFLRSPRLADALRGLLKDRDGLMLGICNGFQALIKLGLVPYGDIVEAREDDPTLTYNTIGRHQSRLVRTRVSSTLSPWLSACRVGDIHTVAVSHGEGRFVAGTGLLKDLASSGRIAAQYVGEDGLPSMDLDVNPNGSDLAVEALTSPDGHVLGKMGHTERSGEGLYRNFPGFRTQPLFASGVAYFAD